MNFIKDVSWGFAVTFVLVVIFGLLGCGSVDAMMPIDGGPDAGMAGAGGGGSTGDAGATGTAGGAGTMGAGGASVSGIGGSVAMGGSGGAAGLPLGASCTS